MPFSASALPSRALRPPAFYLEHRIDLKLDAPVATLDTKSRHLQLVDGSRVVYDALLLATGAESVRLGVPGGNLRHVRLGRSHGLEASALSMVMRPE